MLLCFLKNYTWSSSFKTFIWSFHTTMLIDNLMFCWIKELVKKKKKKKLKDHSLESLFQKLLELKMWNDSSFLIIKISFEFIQCSSVALVLKFVKVWKREIWIVGTGNSLMVVWGWTLRQEIGYKGAGGNLGGVTEVFWILMVVVWWMYTFWNFLNCTLKMGAFLLYVNYTTVKLVKK